LISRAGTAAGAGLVSAGAVVGITSGETGVRSISEGWLSIGAGWRRLKVASTNLVKPRSRVAKNTAIVTLRPITRPL